MHVLRLKSQSFRYKNFSHQKPKQCQNVKKMLEIMALVGRMAKYIHKFCNNQYSSPSKSRSSHHIANIEPSQSHISATNSQHNKNLFVRVFWSDKFLQNFECGTSFMTNLLFLTYEPLSSMLIVVGAPKSYNYFCTSNNKFH